VGGLLGLKEVVEFRIRIQIFLETEDPLMLDDIPDFTFWIEKVSEFPGPRGTGFDAGRIPSLSHPLNAKGTLVHGTLHPRPVPQVMDRGVDLLSWNIGLRPVEDPSFIGAGRDAVPAPNAPVVIHHHKAVGFLPGGMDRTNFHAGRVLAVLALNGQIDKTLLGNESSVIVMFGVLEIDQATPLEPENPDPVELMLRSGVIVFFDTGVDAFSAPDAPGKIQAISPEGIRKGLLRADLEFFSVFFKVSLFQFGDDPLLFLPVHLSEMLLEKVFGFLFRHTGRKKREGKAGQCGQ
jgi:hypothetical protein